MHAPVRVALAALAFIGLGLGSLTLSAHMRAAGAPVHEVRNTLPSEAITPREIAKANALERGDAAPYPSPARLEPKYRFGFLEFEDAPE
jgi:hypothetical protein